MYCKKQEYSQAEPYFQEVVKCAQAIDWQRAITYAQNWLADIALAQDRLHEVELLLQTGLTVSKRSKDKRRIAHYKASFAHFLPKQRNLDEVHHWTKEALDGFERLGMREEAQEMRGLLQELQS